MNGLPHRLQIVWHSSELRTAWTETNRLAALQQGDGAGNARSWFHEHLPSLALWRQAAAFVVLATLGTTAYINWSAPKRPNVYATPVGGHETIRLTDGSTVELNTDTSLRVSVSTDRRIVWLDRGEAYFQINHDPVRPFIVMAGNRRVTDLGTKFVVRREPNRLQVAVVEGRVWLDSTAGKAQSALLSTDQSAIATADAISVTQKPQAKLIDKLGWRHGVLVFDDTTLAEAVAEFNRYNRQKMQVADAVAASQTIGGTFPKNDVEAFTRVARQILGLRIGKSGSEITISRP